MATKTTTAKTKPEPVRDEATFWNEKVPITVPLDTGNPEDQTYFVSVNDYRAQLLRGTEVMVPRYVAKVIQNSLDAERDAYFKRAGMSRDYEQEANKYR